MKRISLPLLVCFLHAVNAYGQSSTFTLNCSTGNDHTQQFIVGLTQVCGVGGGEIVIPPGTCFVSTAATTLQLCNNLTIRGVGYTSVVKVKDNSGLYVTIFSAPPTALSNLVFKDFRVDQNPAGNGTQIAPEHLHVINIPAATTPGVSGITLSGMFFDPTDGVHAIHLESTGDLRATITNNTFNFNKRGSTAYDNTALYLDGAQQVVTGNTFLSAPPSGTPLSQYAGTAIESHGGRSTISNNTANNYATLVNVAAAAAGPVVSPNNVVVGNNSVTCAQVGVSLFSIPSASVGTISSVSITGNTIHVCNNMRRMGSAYLGRLFFAGVSLAYESSSTRSADGLVVSDNVIAMENDSYALAESDAISTGGIVLPATGTLSNVIVSGNVVKNSPMSGIRVGLSTGTAKQVRVVDNTIVDAGNNGNPSTQAIYRHAVGVFGNATEIDVARNMIYDTTVNGQGAATNGLYSLYLKQATAPLTTTIHTSQNTVRVNSTDPTLGLLSGFPTPNAGIVDSTGANNVLVSELTISAPATLNVDFMSFTRYITTITGDSPTALTVTVPSQPALTVPTAQWTVGQLVTFRFKCNNTNAAGCSVNFTSPAYSTNGDLTIERGKGLAITFQIENFSIAPDARRFFELYRTSQTILN